MTPETASGHQPDLVALNGHESTVEEIAQLRQEVARLTQELEAERASAAGVHAQLAVLSRQLDAVSASDARGLLRRKRR